MSPKNHRQHLHHQHDRNAGRRPRHFRKNRPQRREPVQVRLRRLPGTVCHVLEENEHGELLQERSEIDPPRTFPRDEIFDLVSLFFFFQITEHSADGQLPGAEALGGDRHGTARCLRGHGYSSRNGHVSQGICGGGRAHEGREKPRGADW